MFVKRKKLCNTVIKQDLEDGININYTMLAIYYASRLQSIVCGCIQASPGKKYVSHIQQSLGFIIFQLIICFFYKFKGKLS